MKTVIFVTMLLFAISANAQLPFPYFEMRQVITNGSVSGGGSAAVSVTGVLLTNANPYAQATNLASELQADPDYFAGLATLTKLHWHGDYVFMPCWREFIVEHSSSKNAATNYFVLTEQITETPKYLPETWTLAAKTKQDAAKLEKKIKDRDITKKWKLREDHNIKETP